ncbi:MAG: ABC transporter ATP-binding protein [Candidatus Sericytochromatia bacterium]|nr:ABC transporter ATP-binding protein [Candidatus Sericytochromatia bacterium]
MPHTLLHLIEIQKTYGEGDNAVRALQNVSLTVNQGEFVAIMGASGSGKSTLMNLIGCLDKPDAGQYVLAGQNVSALDAAALADIRNQFIGFVFQNFNLLPRTSALENVELPLVYAGIGADERRARATKALTAVGLASRLHHHPNQLSGGQQQRVAIARAIVGAPRVILADEPTGALDSQTSVETMQLFQKLWQEGISVILVTHEHDVAAYAERLITMRDGRVASDHRQQPQGATQGGQHV